MLLIVLGVIGGFIGWMVLFIGIEKIISAVWPAFGVHQKAFEEAIKNGGSIHGGHDDAGYAACLRLDRLGDGRIFGRV